MSWTGTVLPHEILLTCVCVCVCIMLFNINYPKLYCESLLALKIVTLGTLCCIIAAECIKECHVWLLFFVKVVCLFH